LLQTPDSKSPESLRDLRDLRGESLFRLFLRFLRFGLLAWGGPVAQIDLIRHELVDRERWITPERFNRVLGVYQALPGPEATELCCYFGMLARGRLGAIAAGLGFILPGFILMLLASILYTRHGLTSPLVLAAFAAMQPAVAAIMLRAVWRIGRQSLTRWWLWPIALTAALAQILDVHFIITLGVSALLGAIASLRRLMPVYVGGVVLWFIALIVATTLLSDGFTKRPTLAGPTEISSAVLDAQQPEPPSPRHIATTGLKAGLFTFGGAYTAVPIVEDAALIRPIYGDSYQVVGYEGWLTRPQLLDSLAISGILPAPFIIFTTFVGYLGAGTPGALLITACVFLPAFAFTLIGHKHFERLVDNTSAHATLDAITAGVVGIIAVTAFSITINAIELHRFRLYPPLFEASLPRTAILIASLIALFTIKWRYLTPILILASALIGMVVLN